MRRSVSLAAIVLAAVSMSACADSASGPSGGGQVNFNLATRPSATAAGTGLATVTIGSPETFSDGTNTLVIDQVQLVLREIELKRVETTTACGESSNDACEELELGPILLDLPLGAGGAARSFSVGIDTGTYREIEFEIHKPSDDDAADVAFRQAHPDFAGTSVKVTGSFNGVPFTFTSDLNAEEEIELSPPLVVAASAATDITLMVDLDRWFREGGGGLVDPGSALAGGANEGLVETNIQSTLHAFEDEDHDGTDDHSSDD